MTLFLPSSSHYCVSRQFIEKVFLTIPVIQRSDLISVIHQVATEQKLDSGASSPYTVSSRLQHYM